MDDLREKIPITLKEKGNESTAKIKRETAKATKIAETIKDKVFGRIENNINSAIQKFSKSLQESNTLIKDILEDSITKTFQFAVLIVLLCVAWWSIFIIVYDCKDFKSCINYGKYFTGYCRR